MSKVMDGSDLLAKDKHGQEPEGEVVNGRFVYKVKPISVPSKFAHSWELQAYHIFLAEEGDRTATYIRAQSEIESEKYKDVDLKAYVDRMVLGL